jgi:hypothetical protein
MIETCSSKITRTIDGAIPRACGAVRRGAVRCGAVRCGAVRCGAPWETASNFDPETIAQNLCYLSFLGLHFMSNESWRNTM